MLSASKMAMFSPRSSDPMVIYGQKLVNPVSGADSKNYTTKNLTTPAKKQRANHGRERPETLSQNCGHQALINRTRSLPVPIPGSQPKQQKS